MYDRFSAGTHADVSVDEAQSLFVILYVTLGEVLSLNQLVTPEPGLEKLQTGAVSASLDDLVPESPQQAVAKKPKR